MKAPENKEDKKGGFLAFLSRLFGGSSPAGSASSLGTAASGLSGLFASKAGIVGMVLGGATIAAGIGVIYNYVGPSSKPVYSPGLFEQEYYESEAENATAERISSSRKGDMSSSSLEYFKQEAKKENLFGGGEDKESAAAEEDALASASVEGEVEVAGDPGYGAEGVAGDVPKLQKVSGFSSGSKGTRTRIPRMQSRGGLFGGIGSKFQKVYRPPAGSGGKSSSMKGALASKINKSAKYKIPIGKRGGAYGQAKFAKKTSKAGSISASEAGAKTTATEAFEGETGGEGDLAAPSGGAGLGGAGVADGDKLKGNDPSLNMNNSEPPPPPDPEDDTPWQDMVDLAMYSMLASVALIFITRILANVGKTNPLALKIAVITGYAAIAAAALVIYAGMMMMSKYGQKWMGIIYMMMGAALIWQAYQALAGVGKAMSGEKVTKEFAGKFWSKIVPGGPVGAT